MVARAADRAVRLRVAVCGAADAGHSRNPQEAATGHRRRRRGNGLISALLKEELDIITSTTLFSRKHAFIRSKRCRYT